MAVLVDGKETQFKLDTGAEVTGITQDTYHRIGEPQLYVSDKALYGTSRHTLGVLEKFKCCLTHGGIVSQQEVFVVKGLKNNLMGLPAITSSS